MANYDVKIFETDSPLAAICAAITVAKALNLESLSVHFQAGFSLSVSKDSKATDIYQIHTLTLENKRLKKKDNE